MKHSIVTILILLVMAVSVRMVGAQPVTPIDIGIQPVVFGGIALADFDADGDLDIVVTGNEPFNPQFVTRLYRNDGVSASGIPVFTPLPVNLGGLRNPTIEARDYDNDGDIDILLANNQSAIIYKKGIRDYTPVPILDIASTQPASYLVDVIRSPSAASADYDLDGDLDLVIAHANGTTIFRNDRQDKFTEVNIPLPKLVNGSVAWGDYDGDLDVDLLLVSRPLQGDPFIRIFRNDLHDTFTEIDPALPGIRTGSVSWGDYDLDGDLDILIMGNTTTPGNPATQISSVYRNDAGVFVDTGASFVTGVYADWVDYNGDGKLDILVNGSSPDGTFVKIFLQDENGFQEQAGDLPGVWFGNFAVGDLDRDGDRDILMSGRVTTGQTRVPRVVWLRNDAPPRDIELPSPSLSMGWMQGSILIMTWHAIQLENVDLTGYTYNLRVGIGPGYNDILSASAHPDGTRLIDQKGNVGNRVNWAIPGLNPTRSYYWSVQVIDPSGRGSAFSSELRVPGTGRFGSGTGVMGSSSLLDNFPNPFNPQTTIRYSLPEPSHVQVAVYNVLGAEIAVLANGYQQDGVHEVVWDGLDQAGREAPSGVYLYRLITPEQTFTKTMVLLR